MKLLIKHLYYIVFQEEYIPYLRLQRYDIFLMSENEKDVQITRKKIIFPNATAIAVIEVFAQCIAYFSFGLYEFIVSISFENRVCFSLRKYHYLKRLEFQLHAERFSRTLWHQVHCKVG